MKNIILILTFFFCSQTNAQVSKIFGIWNTVEVSDDIFFMNSKKEFHLTNKGKKIYKSEKEATEYLKLKYSENQFIFKEDESFEVKLSEETNLNIFQGKFEIDEINKILKITLKNNALNNLDKFFKYDFENNLLIIEVHFGGSPTLYKLQKK